MVRVEFLGPIQKAPLELEITNLSELAAVLQKDSEMSEWLKNCAVAVNDTLVSSLNVDLKDGDRVSLLPPVCGG
ncbi:MAG: MoaD/ThiS family protein [Sulfurimonas sp.]